MKRLFYLNFRLIFDRTLILPVIGGAKKVVNGKARYMIAISSTVIPILCM
jgi:hypothetical protein